MHSDSIRGSFCIPLLDVGRGGDVFLLPRLLFRNEKLNECFLSFFLSLFLSFLLSRLYLDPPHFKDSLFPSVRLAFSLDKFRLPLPHLGNRVLVTLPEAQSGDTSEVSRRQPKFNVRNMVVIGCSCLFLFIRTHRPRSCSVSHTREPTERRTTTRT